MDQDALDAWRQRCGFPTWEAAAEALGLSKAHMSRYKSGQRPIPRIVANACAGVEARLLVRHNPAPGIRTLERRASDLPMPRLETGHAEPPIRALVGQAAAPQGGILRAAAGWPKPRGREASAPLSGLDSAAPKTDAIAAVASSGYAYAAAATPSRLTKPRGGARLSLLTPIPAPAQPSTAKDKKGDRP